LAGDYDCLSDNLRMAVQTQASTSQFRVRVYSPMMSVQASMELALRASLPHLSFRTQAIVDALRLGGGSIGSAAEVARVLGLSSRFVLGRMLRGQGLPGLRELAAWISVLGWVMLAERSNASLFVIAIRSRRSPAVCYRMVKRLTGLTWLVLKAHGSAWVRGLFVKRCRAIGKTRGDSRGHGSADVGRPAKNGGRPRRNWTPQRGSVALIVAALAVS